MPGARGPPRGTLKKHHLSPLPAVYTKFADFADVFGTAASQVMQCAEVQHRTEREWLRLAGRRCANSTSRVAPPPLQC